ncbi:phage/plasmid primase, P4 family [Caminibacter profundus]
MSITIKTDFDLPIDIIPKELPKEEELINRLLLDVKKINIFEYLKELGWKPKYDNKGNYLPPKQKEIKVGLIEYLLNLAKNKDWKIIKDESDTIYIYNGAYWIPFSKSEIIEFLRNFSLKVGLPLLEAKDEAFIEKLYKQLISALPIRKRKKSALNLINLQNVTFNIETMQLQDFNPNDFLTYQLPFEYNPNAVNHLWLNFLDEVLPDKNTQRTLQEILGSIFIKNIKLEYAYFLYGSGANGKSVIMEVLKALLGTNNLSFHSIEDLNKEYNRAELKDKILNVASEAETREIKSDLFKKLASGEPVIARHLYGRPFEMENYAKLLFLVNRLKLKSIEYTEGFFRRFLIIPFNVTIPKEKRDKKLHLKIINKGLDGVLNWIIEGAKSILVNEDIYISVECEKAFKKFIRDIDSVIQFLDNNNLGKSNYDRYYTSDLIKDYRTWCFENGLKSLGRNELFKRLEALGYIKLKDKRHYFLIGKKED